MKIWYISILLSFPIVGPCGDPDCYYESRTRSELQCWKIKYAMYQYWTAYGIISNTKFGHGFKIKKLECE